MLQIYLRCVCAWLEISHHSNTHVSFGIFAFCYKKNELKLNSVELNYALNEIENEAHAHASQQEMKKNSFESIFRD